MRVVRNPTSCVPCGVLTPVSTTGWPSAVSGIVGLVILKSCLRPPTFAGVIVCSSVLLPVWLGPPPNCIQSYFVTAALLTTSVSGSGAFEQACWPITAIAAAPLTNVNVPRARFDSRMGRLLVGGASSDRRFREEGRMVIANRRARGIRLR